MDSPPIPGDMLVDIFLRLPNPADLVRASAACASFRRLVADRSFLRRYRRLHAPPFLGFLGKGGVFHAAVEPHPSASAAREVVLAADFSFSFLPAPARDWVIQDIRDGRVLLHRDIRDGRVLLHRDIRDGRVLLQRDGRVRLHRDIRDGRVLLHRGIRDGRVLLHRGNRDGRVFRDLAVCDPLHGRCLLLPPIPHDLADPMEEALWGKPLAPIQTFLAPSDDDEETSFSVVSMVQCLTKLVAFVFSSNTGQWRAISTHSWSDLFPGLTSLTEMTVFSCRQYAYGCFYWVTTQREKLLVLDSRRMEFSIAEHPPEIRGIPGGDIAIVEAGEGRPGIFVRAQDTNYLNYAIRRKDFGSSSQWQLEKTIPLDSGYFIRGSMGRHLFLHQYRNPPDAPCFSLDIKTFKLERVFVSNFCRPNVHAYSNFPPSLLSTPTVSSDVGNGAEKETPQQGCVASSSAQSPQSE